MNLKAVLLLTLLSLATASRAQNRPIVKLGEPSLQLYDLGTTNTRDQSAAHRELLARAKQAVEWPGSWKAGCISKSELILSNDLGGLQSKITVHINRNNRNVWAPVQKRTVKLRLHLVPAKAVVGQMADYLRPTA